MASSDPYILVAAIDFGTTFSGYAFQMTSNYEIDNPTNNILCPQSWNSGQKRLLSMKTPTCLLLDRNKDIDSFGYEAEEKYANLCMDKDHGNWYCFRRFKMKLHDSKGLTKHTTLEDETGKKLPALKVFSASIECLKDHLARLMKEKNIVMKRNETKWVLTVPAIWDDSAKLFMREAAKQAKIPPEHLTIALEPEAASLYCQYLPVEKFCVGGQVKFADAKPGTTYMIVDLGGGTADITVHEKVANGKLKEVHRASGGPWGGTAVDGAFLKLLSDIIGGPVFAVFMAEEKYDYLDLMREFEAVKRNISASTKDEVKIKVPATLNETCLRLVKKDFKTLVKIAKKDNQISFLSDKMKMNPNLVRSLFKKATDKILSHMKNILDKTAAGKRVGLILMVGGFSESPFVQDVIKSEFHDKNGKKVLIPRDAGISVLNGAVVYARQPDNITSRILRYTYGVKIFPDFVDGVHEQHRKIVQAGVTRCDGVFGEFICAGSEVKPGHRVQKEYIASRPFQTSMCLNVFFSPNQNTKYVDEPECRTIGELDVQIPVPTKNLCEMTVEYEFGDTELHIKAVEKENNTRCTATLKMLE